MEDKNDGKYEYTRAHKIEIFDLKVQDPDYNEKFKGHIKPEPQNGTVKFTRET